MALVLLVSLFLFARLAVAAAELDAALQALAADEEARAMVVAYDYTVLAGTQGKKNHQKKDRMFELAHRFRLPIVLFGEGGGEETYDPH